METSHDSAFTFRTSATASRSSAATSLASAAWYLASASSPRGSANTLGASATTSRAPATRTGPQATTSHESRQRLVTGHSRLLIRHAGFPTGISLSIPCVERAALKPCVSCDQTARFCDRTDAPRDPARAACASALRSAQRAGGARHPACECDASTGAARAPRRGAGVSARESRQPASRSRASTRTSRELPLAAGHRGMTTLRYSRNSACVACHSQSTPRCRSELAACPTIK